MTNREGGGALPLYEVYAIRYATRAGTRGEMFFDGGLGMRDLHDAPQQMDYFVWAVIGPDRTWVVDTGFARADAEKRKRDLLRTPGEGLREIGVEAASVEDVIVTHLHYDHIGGFDGFPNARFHVQDDEMAFATGRWMTEPAIAHAFEPGHIAQMVHQVFARRVVFHDGDVTLAPGLSLHRVGGHTKGLQVVRVHTAAGWLVLASDAMHFYENFEDRRPFWIVFDMGDYLAAYDTIAALADDPRLIIAGHDPLVCERYPPAGPGLAGIVHRVDTP